MLCTEPIDRAEASTISIRVLRWLVDAVVAAGSHKAAFLDAARINPALLEHDHARISRSEMFRLCEVAIDLTADEGFGLHWGELSAEGAFMMLSQLIAHSSSLEAGLRTLFEYQRLMTDETSYQLVRQGDRVTLRFGSYSELSSRLARLTVEMEAVGLCRLMRWFGAEARPLEVSFAYAAPSYRAEYARIFRGVERFDRPFSGITFSSSLLSAAPPQRDEAVRSALHEIAVNRMLALTNRTPYAVRVREELMRLGPSARFDMSQVALALGISKRTLRRYLGAEGASYTAVANEAASIIAKRLLEKRSIQEVAYEMGFADASSFHRAFKRWTGGTPRSYLRS